MAEEEVHGVVEVRVQPAEKDDEQFPQYHGQVDAQVQSKYMPCCPAWMEEEESGGVNYISN